MNDIKKGVGRPKNDPVEHEETIQEKNLKKFLETRGIKKDYTGILHGWIDEVLEGVFPANSYMILACKRWKRDMERDDIYFDSDLFYKICNFCDRLPKVEGGKILDDGSRECLELARWQLFWIANTRCLFKKCDNTLLHTFCYGEVPRKNFKTTLLACLGLYELCYGDSGQKIISCANTLDQSRIVWQIAKDIVENLFVADIDGIPTSLENDIGKFSTTIKYVRCKRQGATSLFYAIATNKKASDGLNSGFLIADELAQFTDIKFYQKMKTGMGARENAQFTSITTAGETQAGICWEERENGIASLTEPYVEKVEGWEYSEESESDSDSMFCMIFCAEDCDLENWDKVETWIKANPVCESSKTTIKNIRAAVTDARKIKTKFYGFVQDFLNVWGIMSDSFFDVLSIREDRHGLEIEDFVKANPEAEWSIGLDPSERHDLTAMCLCAKANNKFYLWFHGFKPKDTIGEDTISQNYQTFHASNHIELHDGAVNTPEQLVKKALYWSGLTGAESVISDRFGLDPVKRAFKETNMIVDKAVSSLNAKQTSGQEILAWFLEHRILHDGNECFLWCLGNVVKLKEHNGVMELGRPNVLRKIDYYDAMRVALAPHISFIDEEVEDTTFHDV